MKVKEFIELLRKFDQDVEIIATWEGVFRDVSNMRLLLPGEHIKTHEFKEPTLVIDVDEGAFES